MFEFYFKYNNNSDTITLAQVRSAELEMLVYEQVGGYFIHGSWQNENMNQLNTSQAAYNAAKRIMLEYEKPADQSKNAIEARGNKAKEIYKIMLGD